MIRHAAAATAADVKRDEDETHIGICVLTLGNRRRDCAFGSGAESSAEPTAGTPAGAAARTSSRAAAGTAERSESGQCESSADHEPVRRSNANRPPERARNQQNTNRPPANIARSGI